jgi:hypothetical protein
MIDLIIHALFYNFSLFLMDRMFAGCRRTVEFVLAPFASGLLSLKGTAS